MTRSVFACLLAVAGLSVAMPSAQSRPGEIVSGDAATRVDQYLSRLVPFGYSGAVLIAQDGKIVLRKQPRILVSVISPVSRFPLVGRGTPSILSVLELIITIKPCFKDSRKRGMVVPIALKRLRLV